VHSAHDRSTPQLRWINAGAAACHYFRGRRCRESLSLEKLAWSIDMQITKELIGRKVPAAVIVASLAFCSSASAFSIVSDFSISQNPTEVWTYGWLDKTHGTGETFTVYDQLTTLTSGGTIYVWKDSNNPGGRPDIPIVWVNTSGACFCGGTGEYETGWAGFHPGINGYASVYRFTSPDAGRYHISLEFQGADIYGASTQVSVRTNEDVLYSSSIHGNGESSRKSFSGNVSLSTGQVLDIFVTDGGNGQNNDSTAIRGSISAIPETGTWAMMVVGLALIGAAARRRATGAALSTRGDNATHGPGA
jgi:PEP-CTERM motif